MLKKKVLIADSDQKLVVGLKDNLKSRGYNTISAIDGVKALEHVLMELPEVIILGVDLPIINGERLSAIIRSNPKTSNIPIIFLSNLERSLETFQPFKDFLLLKPLNLEQVVNKVNSFYQKIERIEKVSQVDKGLEGNISQIPLVDLIQILSMNKKSGAIMMSRGELKGFVYLQDGSIINSNIGKIEGEKAFFRLLSWSEGKFEFVPTRALTPVRINRSTDSLIMEGMRQLDEWEKLKDTYPPADSLLRLKASPKEIPEDISQLIQEILLLLEFYPRLGDIVDNCSYPDYEVYQAISALLKDGILEVYKKEPKRRGVLKQSILLPDQVFKLRELVTLGRRPGFGIERGKILIIAPRWKAVKAFINTCKDIAGFNLNKEFLSKPPRDSAIAGYVGSLVLSESFVINFFIAPLSSDYKPFWHVFLRGALGILLLFDGGGKELSSSLRDVNVYFYEKMGKPVVFVLFSTKKPTHGQVMKIAEEFSIKKADTLYIVSPHDANAGFLPIHRLLEISIK